MKRLYLVRHAKSTWECDWLDDVERPLNDRGKRDAPAMGALLKRLGYIPDIIISSPAARAYATARIVAEQIGYDSDAIVIREQLFDATTRDILQVIESIDEQHRSAMLFGHNPGLTSTANRLSGAGIDNVPTSGVVAIDLPATAWHDSGATTGSLRSFEYPKKDGRSLPEND
jgi:phosphohistidine phosphatase